MVSSKLVATVGALALAPVASAFDAQAKTNVAVYYGQGTNQQRLSHFCHETSLDIINLGFVNVFPDQGVLGMPGTNFGNQCDGLTSNVGNTSTQFLTGCHQLAEDIPICQAAGKKVLLSLGGDSGSVQKIESEKSAINFADFLWDSFGPKSNNLALLGSPRPFGDAVVDGFDFDIEVGGGNGYATMINRLREHFAEDPSRTFYISGAPQCPIPDAQLGDAIANAVFDFVWVQFYNTEGCSARNFVQGNGNPGFNYDEWVTVIKNSANPDAKLLVGLPASPDMAIEGFYLNPAEVEPLVSKYMNKYSETFGGIMLWEATASDNNVINNGTYADNMKEILYRYGPKPTPTPTPSQTPSHTPSSSSISVHSSSPAPSSSPVSSKTPVLSSTRTASSSSVVFTPSSSVLATSSTKASSSPISTGVLQSSSQVASSSVAPSSTPIASGKPTQSHSSAFSQASSSAPATSTPVASSTHSPSRSAVASTSSSSLATSSAPKASSSPVLTRVSQSSSQVASSSSIPAKSSSSVIASNKPTTSGKPTTSSSVAVSASQSVTSSAVPTALTSKPVISTKSSSSVLINSTPVVGSQSSVIPSASSASVGVPGSSPAITPSASVTSLPSATATESKTVTTAIVTSYIDICPTGFTTVTTIYTTTYCPETAVPATPTMKPSVPTGWTTVATVCTHCAATPTTVTLTLPPKTTGPAGAMSTGTSNGNESGNSGNTVTGTETDSTITATVIGNNSMPKPSGALSSHASQKPQDSAGTSLRVPTAAVTPSGPVSTPLIRVPTGTGSARASSTLYARPTGTASRVPVSPSGTTGTEPLFTGGAAKNVGSGVAIAMAVAAVLL